MAEVTVTVDVELDEFDDDSLVDEVRSRGFSVGDGDQVMSDSPLREVYRLLACNEPDRAIAILHPYLRDILGKAL